ncbi:biotin-dependent carboxyltransferase family protein [Amycolatopsis methanolica]|uniref:Urea amidolyase related protein n=1 Tax=Amycolatopsis methanolica 239 TaxID=1068978 RepID=A0A076MNG3_AMYME|nr:biotin-dependent carboxyltransferase family protein [Amycolatopsis methanolica]AIJ22169.1 urea amidolyase related protein [Amycolatopsis methanolica 239]
MAAVLEVVDSGPLSTVQDLGRPGYADIGVTESGAADRASLRLANRLAGNDEGAAGIEVTFGGFAARATTEVTIAVAGAPCPITIDRMGAPMNAALRVPVGSEFRLGWPATGLRSYVAVRGGIAVEPVLGSRATDLLSGLGPDPLRRGVLLPIGAAAAPPLPRRFTPVAAPPSDELALRILPGPRDDWFTESALRTLLAQPYAVTSESNRIGIRLEGPALPRARHGELVTEGMVTGALQVPPSGKPTLFLADHPVTGGYPVIAVVVTEDVDKAAQARPGLQVRFDLAEPARV